MAKRFEEVHQAPQEHSALAELKILNQKVDEAIATDTRLADECARLESHRKQAWDDFQATKQILTRMVTAAQRSKDFPPSLCEEAADFLTRR
jgi:hypothetical protein